MQKLLFLILLALLCFKVTSVPWLLRDPSGAIYIIIRGTTARYITEPATYNNLFKGGVYNQLSGPVPFPKGPPIDSLAILVQPLFGLGSVYLL